MTNAWAISVVRLLFCLRLGTFGSKSFFVSVGFIIPFRLVFLTMWCLG